MATFIAAVARYVWAADLRRAAQLVDVLRREASSQGISTMFVPADDDDPHALPPRE